MNNLNITRGACMEQDNCPFDPYCTIWIGEFAGTENSGIHPGLRLDYMDTPVQFETVRHG